MSSVILHWTDAADNEAGYEIIRATYDGVSWGDWAVFTVDRDSASFGQPVPAAAEYAYFVRSYNGSGVSDWVYVGVPGLNVN